MVVILFIGCWCTGGGVRCCSYESGLARQAEKSIVFCILVPPRLVINSEEQQVRSKLLSDKLHASSKGSKSMQAEQNAMGAAHMS